MSGVKDPERPWRLKVAIDDIGDRLVRNTVTAILPRSNELDEDAVLYGLFAYLGSGFVSAWLDENVTTRYMSSESMLLFPHPSQQSCPGCQDVEETYLTPLDGRIRLLILNEKYGLG